jgi:hypothetical protein
MGPDKLVKENGLAILVNQKPSFTVTIFSVAIPDNGG